MSDDDDPPRTPSLASNCEDAEVDDDDVDDDDEEVDEDDVLTKEDERGSCCKGIDIDADEEPAGSLAILGTFIDSLLIRSLASASSMNNDSLRCCELTGILSAASSR